jgi:diguanylate cyclase (GGDEF)-like protein
VAGPTIGYLAPATAGFFFGGILSGAARMVHASGGTMIALQSVEASPEGLTEASLRPVDSYTLEVGWSRLDGVVSVAGSAPDQYLRRLVAFGVPLALVCREVPGLDCPTVVPDNRTGIAEAVTHLVAHGHRKIGFVGNLIQPDMRERFEAYREALAAHDLPYLPGHVFEATDNVLLGGEHAARQLLGAGVPTTALVVATDRNALALMRTLAAAGLNVPDDQAVIGFDDVEEGAQFSPALSSVNPGFARLGEIAAQLLLGGQAGVRQRRLGEGALMIRQSCGCGDTVLVERSGAAWDSRSARERLELRLAMALGLSPEEPGSFQERMRAGAQAAVEAISTPGDGSFDPVIGARAVEPLHDLSPRFESSAGVVRALHRYVLEAAGSGELAEGRTPHVSGVLVEMFLGIMRADSLRALSHQAFLEHTMNAGYDIGATLLADVEIDPSDLGWMRMTDSPVGCLAMWPYGLVALGDTEAPPLVVTGVWHRHRDLDLVGRELRVRDFPPQEVLDAVDPAEGEILYIIPIKQDGHYRAMLATVGPVEARALRGRDRSNQWAALMTMALQRQRAAEEASAAQRREQALLLDLRLSEERYALAARAANDGLWDWNLLTGEVFYSARWNTLVGRPPDSPSGGPEEWFARVHQEDLPGLLAAIRSLRDGSTAALSYEHRMRVVGEDHRWMLCRGVVQSSGRETTRMVGSLTDIDARKQLESQLRRGAMFDALTGLANRTQFSADVEAAIEANLKDPAVTYAVLFCDLDGFKDVNDGLGHHAGDLLLVELARRIADAIRGRDVAGRLGGDEFAVLLNDIELDGIPTVLSRLRESICQPVTLGDASVTVGVSIGVATSEANYERVADVLRDADAAMYQMKPHSRGNRRRRQRHDRSE